MGGGMQIVGSRQKALDAEADLSREEAKIDRVARVVRIIAVCLAAAALAFLVVSEADHPWQYLAYPLLISVPVAYSVVSARYIRLMHVSLLRRYQAQLVIRTMELEEMASKDELTQLYNRRYFYDCIQAQLEEARTKRDPLAILLLDIDGLKGINDEHGHMVGDVIIAKLGEVIAKQTRSADVPARLGGDEFGVILPGTDKRGAFAMAQRLWEELERTPMFEGDGKRIMINVSIGVSGFPWGGEDVDEMMHWADSDMYVNKVSRRLPPQPVTADVRREEVGFLPEDHSTGF